MKSDQKLYQAPNDVPVTKPYWINNPKPETDGLWKLVKNFLLFFVVTHLFVVLISITLGLEHPLTLFNFSLFFLVPIFVLMAVFFHTKRKLPDGLFEINLATWLFRIFVLFGANIALIVSVSFDVFPIIFSALLIACIGIELLAYLTYRSYSDDMIREIIEENKVLSPVNNNNEFWFLTRGGDVGSDRLFIKGKWHLRLFYVMVYIAPFGVVSGSKAIGAFLAAFVAIAMYFMLHGLFTGYYVSRRGLQMRLEGKL